VKINPLNKDIFSKKIDDSFNIFYIFGNNLGLIDICYSKLKNNLEIDLDNPFITNYFDENKLLNNTEAFFDELNSISLFNEKKTIIIDIRQSDKKNDVNKIFTEFNFSEIKDTQIIIITYLFKQTDVLSKKLINSKNAICFTCYEENEYDVKNSLKKELAKINLNLNESQIYELTSKFSKDTKIIQNTFEKIRLQNKNGHMNFDQLLLLIDDNNDETTFEMINKLMIGNYYEAINLLTNFERINFSSNSILYLIKSKFKLLQKCINMRKNGLTKSEIVNNKSLNIFYKEHSLIFKMLDLWTLSNIDECLYHLFKTELNCKSKKECEYIFLNQLFLYIYFKIKLKPN
jgi:DNA polymerase III delta subunit